MLRSLTCALNSGYEARNPGVDSCFTPCLVVILSPLKTAVYNSSFRCRLQDMDAVNFITYLATLITKSGNGVEGHKITHGYIGNLVSSGEMHSHRHTI
jgi:hypothetical protein